MSYMRHTMGQDWGGRKKMNPSDCPLVTRFQVETYAKLSGINIKREGKGMWWFFDGNVWRTLGQTNYLAIEHLKRLSE